MNENQRLLKDLRYLLDNYPQLRAFPFVREVIKRALLALGGG